MGEKKRKQHYVWEHYLKAWATDGRVWCQLAQRATPVCTSTENIGQSRDFYRLKEMSEQDVRWVELLIGQAIKPLADLARGWVPAFRAFHEAKRAYEMSGEKNPELERLLDESINDLEEDLHAGIEDRAVPLLAKLREADVSFLDGDEESTNFFWFIAALLRSVKDRGKVSAPVMRRSRMTSALLDVTSSCSLCSPS